MKVLFLLLVAGIFFTKSTKLQKLHGKLIITILVLYHVGLGDMTIYTMR